MQHQEHSHEPVAGASQPPDSCSSCDHGHDHASLPRAPLVGASGLFLSLGMLWPDGPVKTACFVLSTAAGGLLVLPPAWAALRRARLDMNVLMTVAVAGAWAIGEGNEAAAVVFLFALSELLESWSAGRARRAIASLLELAPETALVRGADGMEVELAVAEVQPGALISIRSGARIPLDGIVKEGASTVNQAPITGESVPVEKEPGDAVFAGTINGEGSLLVQVSKAASDSTLSRIVRLVGEAEGTKAPTQRFVDRFARVYTPAVFGLALLVALIPPVFAGGAWAHWGYRALVLLVIACPCALVIATPVSIVSGLTALARRGVLIKGGSHLETVGRLRALAVDKTGTITRGRPELTRVVPLSQETEERILAKAAAIDGHSTHPLARAVVLAAGARGVSPADATDYRSLPGRGATATIEGHPHFIGNHKLAHEMGACSPEVEASLAEVESSGQSLAILGHAAHSGCRAEALGLLAIGDAIRPEVRGALALLRAAGLQRIVMLSGDNQRTVDAIARATGIDEAHGDLLPDDKLRHLRELLATHGTVAMIGDGVNDAPALALASVGIAMGAIGSDTAIETADMALMQDDLTRVADAISTGRRTLSVIRFNIAFALGVKAVFLTLAFTGHASLWLAILADTGATLLVILNALRLLR